MDKGISRYSRDWKSQYRLLDNWSLGRCSSSEIVLSARYLSPQTLVRLQGEIVITADSQYGLRTWMTKGEHHLMASLSFKDMGEGDTKASERTLIPTSLSTDLVSDDPISSSVNISIGFSDGTLGIYRLGRGGIAIKCLLVYASKTNECISAIAYKSSYIVTLNDAHLLSLYYLPPRALYQGAGIGHRPRLVSCLQAQVSRSPLSLSLRVVPSGVVASIAYAVPTYFEGWSIGLQELRLSTGGTIAHSRFAFAAEKYIPLSVSSLNTSSDSRHENHGSETGDVITVEPTSLSYSHPYLLASLPDNTLVFYLVHSTDDELRIGSGTKLWGHTSSISDANVGDRGKAVSISRRGEDIRLWELEENIAPSISGRKVKRNAGSVRVRLERETSWHFEQGSQEGPGIEGANATGLPRRKSESAGAKGWVGFDDERVVVLKGQRDSGPEALVVYDFT